MVKVLRFSIQFFNQSINQSINQSVNQSINQSVISIRSAAVPCTVSTFLRVCHVDQDQSIAAVCFHSTSCVCLIILSVDKLMLYSIIYTLYVYYVFSNCYWRRTPRTDGPCWVGHSYIRCCKLQCILVGFDDSMGVWVGNWVSESADPWWSAWHRQRTHGEPIAFVYPPSVFRWTWRTWRDKRCMCTYVYQVLYERNIRQRLQIRY